MTNKTSRGERDHEQETSLAAETELMAILRCPSCLGKKKEPNGKPCQKCDDGTETNTSHGLAPFYYESIRGEDNLQTINKQAKITVWLTRYLHLHNAEDLRGWWGKYDTPEKNKKHFQTVIGEGYIGKELRQNRRLQHKSQTGYFGYLKKLYVSNGFTDLPWDHIEQNIRQPEGLSRGEFDAYTLEQIETLHNKASPKYQTLITVLMSGMRIGGIQERILARDIKKYPNRDHFLKVGDLSDPLEGLTDKEKRDFKLNVPHYDESPIYQMTVYSGDVNAKTGNIEYYTCWTTSEARQRIDDLLYQRLKDGELDEIDPRLKTLKREEFNIKYFHADSPLFRTHYNPERSRVWMTAETREIEEKKRLHRLHHPEHLRYGDIEIYFRRLRKKYLDPMPIRVKLFNGFRSYAQTVLTHDVIVKGVHLAESEVDWFLGRQLKRMGPFYDKWGKLNRVKTWWEAIPHLTINKKKYLLQIIEEKQKTIDQKEAEKQEQWAAFSGAMALVKQNIQDVAELKKQINPAASSELLKILLGKLTPEQLTEAQAEAEKLFLPNTNSSLPSEEQKPALIDVTPPKRKDDKEEEHI